MTDPQISKSGGQTLAADPECSVWVSANAGTGKTHVLIDRISRLLLSGTAPERILCLTFTKAAAAEMANRLSARLGLWAAADGDALEESLRDLLGRPATEKEKKTARGLFTETLDAPGGLKIRTIHSFCESLLGRFPLEAGVAPHFSVIDERTAAEMRREARDRVFTDAFNTGQAELTGALEHLAGLIDEDGFTRLMGELSNQGGHLSRLIGRHGSLDGVIGAAWTALGLAAGESLESIIEEAARETDRTALGRAAAALEQGSGSDKSRAGAIRSWLKTGGTDVFTTAYSPVFLTKQGTPKAEKNLITKAAQKTDAEALPILLAEQERVAAIADRLKALAAGKATAALLALGAALLRAYAALKETMAFLDYDDLIGKARGLLSDGGGVSWVHYKLDGGLDHILVDEAQDTSPEQWAVIKALAGDFFSGLGAQEANRTVFAVGDEKQSIYSFQGADPEAFDRMRAHFEADVTAAEEIWQFVELEISYRSTLAVLKAVDAVFSHGPARDGLSATDRPIIHHTKRVGQGGLVEVWPTVTPIEDPPAAPWDAPLDQVSAMSPEARLAERIAGRIWSWLEDGVVLESAGRPIRPGDIMILVRRRGRFAQEMVRCLKQRSIPVAGSDRMVLCEQLAVMDLIALGRFLLLPEDDLTLAIVLKSPLFALTEDDLFALAYGRKGALWSALKERRGDNPHFEQAWDELSSLLAGADFKPPFEFYSDLLGPRGARKKLLARLGPEAADPMDEFLALALDYEREHVASLEGFLHWMETGETQVKRDLEHGRQEVRVITVHGSKGLQSNIVFLPDTCGVPDPGFDPRLLRDDENGCLFYRSESKAATPDHLSRLRDTERLKIEREYRRLLYVAMTRARDRLYICGWEGKKGRPDGCWYDLVETALKDAEGIQTVPGEDGDILRLTCEQSTAPEIEPQADDRAMEETVLPAWAKAPAPPEPEPTRPLVPSHMEDDEAALTSPIAADNGARFKRGRLIHRLLQSLPDLPAKNREKAARAFLARPVNGLTPDQQEEITTETLKVLDHPDHAGLFGTDGKAEVPLIGRVAGRVVSARLDRLVVSGETVTVIDFKTNRPPPKNPDAVPAATLRQMALYREALRNIYPGFTVRAVLLWTDGPRLMELPGAMLDLHIPKPPSHA